MHYWLYKFVQRVHNITTSKKQLYRFVNTLLNLPQTCAEKLSFAVVQKRVDTLKFHWNYVHYWLYKFVQRVHNITTSKKQIYRLVNTLLNLPQTCAEKLSFAVVQKRVNTLKFHWNYVHYWLYKFLHGLHNITTSKKQIYRFLNTLLNLPQTCEEKLSFAVVQKRVETLKFHWNYVHYWLYKFVQRVHNITTSQKQLYRLVNTLLNLPQTCAEKLSFAVVQKKVDTEISLKLYALLVLQVCAKGAQQHNKQKTTLQACKHLAKFAAILCRKVEFCRSTKENRQWNFIEIMCIIGSTSLCMACTHHNKQKTTLQACKHLAKFAANLCRKVEFCRSTKEGRNFDISLKLCIIGSTSLCMACTTSQQAKNNSTGL